MKENEISNSNNPTAADVESQKEGITGHDLLLKINDCRQETLSLLSKIPSKLEEDTFNNVLSQVMNDQQICLKYIDILESNIASLNTDDIKALKDALTSSKIRIASEMRMVKILKDENPYSKNLADEEIIGRKQEELYNLNTYISMSRGHEEMEWDSYGYVLQQQKEKEELPKNEDNSGLNFFSFIILGIFAYVLLTKTSLGQKIFKKGQNLINKDDSTKK